MEEHTSTHEENFFSWGNLSCFSLLSAQGRGAMPGQGHSVRPKSFSQSKVI
jgi:hypothetical protein